MMSPLLQRNRNDVLCRLRRPLPCLACGDEISAAQFVGHVMELSQHLPTGAYAINMCANRYLFLLAFCAVIVRGQTNLLPPNRNLSTQQDLATRFPDCYVIHDGEIGQAARQHALTCHPDLAIFNLSDVFLGGEHLPDTYPQIASHHLCAVSFTSGSTGQSKPNLKSWRTLRESSLINVRYMVPPAAEAYSLLATVPGQHMWGLESSVLNVLFANLTVSDAQPLFPQDIKTALAALPSPRVLVSTPVHFRAMLASGLNFPRVERLLCATAPLDLGLATNVEQHFQGELLEIYGCSEVGSMAFRQTSHGEAWRLFAGMHLQQRQGGTFAHADHLPDEVMLQDVVELRSKRQFWLRGRNADMINIAGKRGSLQEINRVLLSDDAVLDGHVFIPDTQTKQSVPRLVALVVVKADFDKQMLEKKLRATLDPAFIPRAIYCVDNLPREDSGKLSKQRLRALYADLSKSSKPQTNENRDQPIKSVC